jgi:polyhydroxybutyrate depolymerase
LVVTAGAQERAISVRGRTRRYVLLPPAGGTGPAPLVVALHGSTQNPASFRVFSDPSFDRLAEHHGAFVAYPQGFEGQWNDARVQLNFAARRQGYDDVEFISTLIGEVVAGGAVDPTRVYVVGFSNGGSMVTRLAHEVPGLFAAVAILSSTQPAPENFAPGTDAHKPLPVLLIHGTADPVSPYEGGAASLFGSDSRGEHLSVSDSAAYWAQRNGIVGAPRISELPRNGRNDTFVRRIEYAAAGREPVVLLEVVNGGHTIPGHTRQAPRLMGRTSHQISGVDEVAAFFGLAR